MKQNKYNGALVISITFTILGIYGIIFGNDKDKAFLIFMTAFCFTIYMSTYRKYNREENKRKTKQ